ncbi:MAG: Rne/Rng family ribonuclease [Phycisphaerae bacterium]|nr:Rne/Rng family ribonuclease [Phycisphaerae bacterium]
MPKEMLISTVQKQECRIAIVSGGNLEELYIERPSSASHVGNIYKGQVTNIEPAIQAAFVDFGLGKNGFLHVSDLHPDHFPKRQGRAEPVGKKQPYRDRPPIQSCLKRGQQIVVQVTKEGIGTKGATLTTYLSVPGRLLVLMPGMSRLGVSRRLEDDNARLKARTMLEQLDLPDDMGIIVRTAAVGHDKRQFQRDLNYLLRLWKAVKERIRTTKAPAEIYQESDLLIRTIRDIYNSTIGRIICDSRSDALNVKEFLNVAVPRHRSKVELYVGTGGLFHDFGLEDQIEKIYSRRVSLPSGGSLVIDQTEALVAIDVNSGRYRGNSNPESTAFKMNIEAAGAIARQLRLRDLGGVIIIDFIDLYQDKHCRAVERALRDGLKDDRAKTKTSRMSTFGILEMTRQRVRPSLRDSMHRWCPYCDGVGLIKSEESQALEVMRDLRRAAASEEVARIEVAVTPEVAQRLSNLHRGEIHKIEQETNKAIFIRADAQLSGNEVQMKYTNHRGSAIELAKLGARREKAPPKTINIQEVIAAERKTGLQGKPKAAPQAEPKAPPPSDRAAKAEKPRRRRSRRKRKTDGPVGDTKHPVKATQPSPEQDKPEEPKRKKTRRGTRGGARRRKKKKAPPTETPGS